MKKQFDKAIVIGGSLAGLAAARVLANHFSSVTVLEKDDQLGAGARRGVPQGTHVHGLQPHALALLNDYFPSFEQQLIAAGAVTINFGENIGAFLADGWAPRVPSAQTGLSLTRPFLEEHVRTRLADFPNVTIKKGLRAVGLTGNRVGVTGAIVADNGQQRELETQLIVDASGRGTRGPRWLKALGFGDVPVSRVHIDVRYATCIYQRPPNETTGYIVRHYPMEKLGAALLPVENDQWLLSLSGRFDRYPGKDHKSFLASAATLPVMELYDLLESQPPTTEVTAYTFSHNEWRHFEQLESVPSGYVPLGDSLFALNPLYGQGMTSCLAQAKTLDVYLQKTGGDAKWLGKDFIAEQAAFAEPAWQRSLVGDSIFAEVSGDLPSNLDALRAADAALNKRAAQDPKFAAKLFQVNQFALLASVLDEPV